MASLQLHIKLPSLAYERPSFYTTLSRTSKSRTCQMETSIFTTNTNMAELLDYNGLISVRILRSFFFIATSPDHLPAS